MIRIHCIILGWWRYLLQKQKENCITHEASQIFRSWVEKIDPRRPVVFLSLSLYDTPGRVPHMTVLFWGPGDFPVSYSSRHTSLECLKSSFRKFFGRYGDLDKQYRVSLSRMLIGILSLDKFFDFPTAQTVQQFRDDDTEFDLHRITSGFHGAFSTGMACQKGTLTLPDTWFRPFLGLVYSRLV